jgi:hypothetical protein
MSALAIQYARSYGLEAERRMGELLAESAENGSRATKNAGRPAKVLPIVTLPELGISRRESSEAQLQKLHGVTLAPALKDIGLIKRESAEAQQ